MAIYTRTGDQGTTSIVGGRRVAKNDLRLEVYGTLDELNSFVGLTIAAMKEAGVSADKELRKIQSQLFTAGGLVSTEVELWSKYWNVDEVKANVTFLEQSIDAYTAQLQPQRTFLLPGGSQVISLLHVCRTVCRRAERNLCTLQQSQPDFSVVAQYLNRLSDFFYILARFCHKIQGVDEIDWKSVD